MTGGEVAPGGLRASDAPDHSHQTAQWPVVRLRGREADRGHDHVVGEEPLVVRIAGPGQEPIDVATTMRTPGHEADLAVGLLFSEGLLSAMDVVGVTFASPVAAARPDDQITVHVSRRVDPASITARHGPVTASCGVCGRTSIDDLLARCRPVDDDLRLPAEVALSLPETLRDRQGVFAKTGGLHAAGIAGPDGELRTVREDVGRHNALDAAIGHHVRAGEADLHGHVAVLSGRIGFELVQKAAVARIGLLVAVGAPTDLAVRTAEAVGMTLIGFARDGTGNVYSAPHRVQP